MTVMNDLSAYIPASTPHILSLFCAQVPFVLTERQINLCDYRFYPVSQLNLERHFTFSMRNWNEGRYHTLLTYSLVHYNWSHFWQNFISIACSGSHVISRAGSPIFWMIAMNGSICGGLAALIEYKYHHQQSRLQISKKEKEVAKSLWNMITQPVNDVVNYYGNKVIDRTFQVVNEAQGMVGCSSAVYALYAFDFAITIDRAKDTLYKLWRRFILRDDSVYISQEEQIYTIYDIITIYGGIKRIQSDVEYMWLDKKSRSKVEHMIVASPDNIAHCSHIGGFVGGLITFGLWKAYQKRRYKLRPPDEGPTGSLWSRNLSTNSLEDDIEFLRQKYGSNQRVL